MEYYTLKEIFHIYGGTSGLTEKIIYENYAENEIENIAVFSGATDERYYLPKVKRNLSIDNKSIKKFTNDNVYILVARKGKAGTMSKISNLNFTINDDAYVMKLKKQFSEKVNIDFFISKFQDDFYELVSSKDSNGTFSKEVAENYEIELPSIDFQNSIIKEHEKLLIFKNKLLSIKVLIESKKSDYIVNNGKTYLISELFHHFQGHQLTDKYIYDNPGSYPVYSGSSNVPKGFIKEPLFDDVNKLPCLIYQTKGNNEYKSRVVNELFNANNTAVLTVKNSKKNIVNIEYIQLILAHNMKLSISSQEGVSYIDTKILNTEIYLPDIEEQNRIVEQNNKIKKLQIEISNMINKIENQINEKITII